MKVLGLTGSPRENGNTDRLVKKVLSGAREKGADVAHYNLDALDIKGCRSCFHCKTHEGCALEDDMRILYGELRSADAVVLGTPVYMDQMSAQAKLFLDRLYAMMNKDRTPKLKTNPSMILAVTQANPHLDAYRPYFETLEKRMERFGFRVNGTIIAGGTHEKDDVDSQTELMALAEDSGRKLCRPA